MENPWNDIADLKPDVENPINIVKNLFSPIYEKTNEKVIYKLQEVYFFPEEVKRYTPLTEADKEMLDQIEEIPHPDFGYDPYKTKEKQYFRYRLLLSPIVNDNIEYELFKFKFPLLFYPIKIFY